MVPGLTIGVDGYYKISNNLIDEGQFGAPIILTAFNYAHGRQEGVQFTASYDRGPWSIYGNLAWSRALGKDITSAQFNFGADELAFIGNNFIHLDHDQTWDGSAGVAYTLNKGGDHPTLFSVDALLQSGLRASTDDHSEWYRAADLWPGESVDRAEVADAHGAAAGCAECGRHSVSDTQRHRSGRRCAAIWATADNISGAYATLLIAEQ